MTENGGKTVLIVDDTEDNRTLAACFLRANGYRTAVACDGLDALNYLRTHEPPDAILLDLRMPHMDGYQFLVAQESEPGLSLIPVVIYSCETGFLAREMPANVVGRVLKTGGGEPLIRAIRCAVSSAHMLKH